MNSDLSLPAFLVPAVGGLLIFIAGWVWGRFTGGRKAAALDPAPVLQMEPEDEDDPTAPIVPMVEMSRSPHDRHRDITVGKGLVKQIDFLDAMVKSATKKGDTDIINQLGLLRREFIDLLKECSVEAFDYAPDTVVDAGMRSRIQIVGGTTRDGERTRIAETLQCGFLYLHGDEDTMMLRKAEVLIK